MYPLRPMTATRPSDSPTRERANELIRAWDGRPGPLGSLLGRVTAVDQVGVEERVDALRKRSIKKASKVWALELAISMMDLTTLEGKDTPGKVRAMCVKAMRPLPGDPTIPSVAAVCVYPALVAEAKEALRGSTVKVASVATGFPSGQTFRDIKVAEVRAAVAAGADEVDMVIDRGAFLSGDYLTVFEEIVEVKEAAGEAHLKVILETGELETYDNVRRASVLAMAAGADFIKTSTGKVTPAATMPVTLVMLEAIRDFERSTGRQVGMKPAGGIRTAKEAIQYLVDPVRDPRSALDVARLVPVRCVEPAQRRADADRVPALRPLPGPGRLHARLTDPRRRGGLSIPARPVRRPSERAARHPALTRPLGGRPMSDARIIQFEILGQDQAALQAYYTDLFGWKLDTGNQGGYGMTDAAATGVTVGVGATRNGSAGGVTGYITVDDIDATLARATALGGNVVMPKFSPGPGATIALFADPSGNVIGLTQN